MGNDANSQGSNAENERLRESLVAAKTCAWEWDLETEELRWSSNMPALYERDAEEIGPTFGDYLETCVHPDDRATLAEAFARARNEGADFQIEFCAMLPDGRTRWLEHGGRASRGRLMGITTDIGERKEHEIALRVSEHRLRMLVESATEYAIFTTDNQRLVTGWNTGAERITGFSEAEILGRSADVVFTPEDRADGAPAREIARARADGRAENERWHMRKDGSRFFGSGFVEPMRDESGEIQGFVKIMRDNTDRKRAEAERALLLASEREARSVAETANRAKDEFLAVVSHELRTPLNAMLGWAQILRAKASGDPIVARGLETITRNAVLQSKLIEDILDISRVTSGNLRITVRTVDLASVVAAAVDSVSADASKKGVGLTVNIEPAVGHVSGDPDRLQQVVWNLLSNAIKFTPAGGHIDVALARASADAEIVVRDTGAGIDPDFLPHVFERFRQADTSKTRRHGGLGLGLSIVRHLVVLHGGSVHAESEGEGRGSTFVVTLPLAAETDRMPDARSADSARTEPAGEGARRLLGLRVLAVDDDPDAIDLLMESFGRQGAEVRGATSADEAIAEIGRERPDVLVSDIGMPEKDGFSLIRAVRASEAEGTRTPAIAVTAFVGAEDRALATQAGFDAYIPKPIDLDELARLVVALAGREEPA